jgi:hypothetical protein
MSWINDALKSAEQARPEKGGAAERPQLLSGDCPTAPSHVNVPLTLLAAAALLASAFMTWQWFCGGNAMKVRARTNDSAAAVPAPVAQTQTAPPETKEVAVTSTNALVENKPAAEVTQAAVAETPKPEPVTYKLQGILFQPGHSSAVINGHTVYAGERVADARVVSVSVDTVVLVDVKGQTNILELP